LCKRQVYARCQGITPVTTRRRDLGGYRPVASPRWTPGDVP